MATKTQMDMPDNDTPFNVISVGADDKTAFTDRTLGKVYEYYLFGEIEEPIKYVNWFNAIRHACKEDLVKIYINSPGGNLYTAIQFMRVLRETGATVIGSVEGACMSAATLIFLSCTAFEVSAHASFMFHNYSGGAFGKGGEMSSQLDFEKVWSKSLFHDAYEDFLTDREISGILDGKDIWLSSVEVVERLRKREVLMTKRNKTALKALEHK